jgi:glycosyltransferase involved in cell wall biosynthesis
MNISFIVPCYNCESTLVESVESIFDGNFSEGDEVILVDDCSSDATPNLICQLKKKYRGVISIQHHINKGSAAASRNSGIDASRNELLFCLDSDNILVPNSVSKLKMFLFENNLDAAAFGEIRYFKLTKNKLSEIWKMNSELNFIEALNNPSKTPCGSGNYLFTKNIWKKGGRYNESLGGALDSEIFGLCILAIGAKFRTLPNSGYFHRYGYHSTYIKDIGKANASLVILSGIIKHINLIDAKSIDYMFGSGRTNWWHNSSKRPIKAATQKKQVIKTKVKRRIFAILETI